MSESKKPLPSLDDLQRKIEDAQTLHGLKDDGDDDEQSRPHNMGQALQVGIELVAGVGVGCFVGYYLDQWMGTKPWFFIICFLLGAVAGFKNLIKRAQAGSED